MPDIAKAARPDAIIATGRSDFPNQVNNVLCFPFIFRGALDVGATTINEAMKLACVRAIADLAMAEQSDIVAAAYGVRGPVVRPRLPDPQAVRSAPHRADRAGGGAGGDGVGRRDAARSPTSTRTAQRLTQLRLPLRPADEADLHGGQAGAASASCTPRARTSACCAPCRWSIDERLAEPDPGRPPGGDRAAHRALRPAHQARQGLRDHQSRAATRAIASTGREY